MELSQQEKGHGGGGATISSERDWAGLGTERLAVRLETQVGEGSQDETGRRGTKNMLLARGSFKEAQVKHVAGMSKSVDC